MNLARGSGVRPGSACRAAASRSRSSSSPSPRSSSSASNQRACAPTGRDGDVVEAELGDFAGAIDDAPRQPFLLEEQERLERRTLRDALDALAQLALRPLGRRRVGGDQRLELLATQYAGVAGDELLQREAHPAAGLAAPQVVPGGQKTAVGSVEKGVAVTAALAGVDVVAGERRRFCQTGERSRVRHCVLGLYFHAVTLP